MGSLTKNRRLTIITENLQSELKLIATAKLGEYSSINRQAAMAVVIPPLSIFLQ